MAHGSAEESMKLKMSWQLKSQLYVTKFTIAVFGMVCFLIGQLFMLIIHGELDRWGTFFSGIGVLLLIEAAIVFYVFSRTYITELVYEVAKLRRKQ